MFVWIGWTLDKWTFIGFISLVQFLFYFMCYACHLLHMVRLERILYIHGSYIVNGALWTAIWFLPEPFGTRFWTFDSFPFLPSVDLGFDQVRNTLWIPILLWGLFVFSRRYYFGILHWEIESLMDGLDQEVTFDAKFVYNTPLITTRIRYYCRMISVYTLPCVCLVFWEIFFQSRHSLSDFMHSPSTFQTFLVGFVSTAVFRIYLSMIHFQYKLLAWVIPYKNGIIIRSFQGQVQYGIVY